jgi:hypothetical protein
MEWDLGDADALAVHLEGSAEVRAGNKGHAVSQRRCVRNLQNESVNLHRESRESLKPTPTHQSPVVVHVVVARRGGYEGVVLLARVDQVEEHAVLLAIDHDWGEVSHGFCGTPLPVQTPRGGRTRTHGQMGSTRGKSPRRSPRPRHCC